LCAGEDAQAKQPATAPEPGGPATPPQSAGRGPDSVQNSHRVPAVQHSPVSNEPADRGPVSRPSHQSPTRNPPAGQEPAGASKPDHRAPVAQSKPTSGEPVGRRPHGQGRPSEPPGRHVGLLKRPTHEPREHGRGLGPQRPVVPDAVRPNPRPEPEGPRPASNPKPQRPTPHPVQPHPPDKEGTGRPEGAGSQGKQGQQGQPGGLLHPPGGENVPPRPEGPVEPPQHAGQPHERAPVVGPSVVGGPGQGAGTGQATTPAKSPVRESKATNAPPGIRTEQPPDRLSPAQTLPGSEPGSRTRPTTEPLRRPAETTGTRSAAEPLRLSETKDGTSQEPTGGGSNTVHPPGRQSVTSQRTIETERGPENVPAAPPHREQQPCGDQAQSAQGTSFGSTKNLVDPTWDDGKSLAQQVQQILRSSKGGARDLSTGSPREGSLTQRGPPLEVPLPFSGLGPVAGSAAGSAGSSGVGSAPLLAVIVSCFFALLCLNLARVYNAVLRPGTVPRLALERPG